MKSTFTYWNPLDPSHEGKWETLAGTDEKIQQLTLAIDAKTGDYTRLTKFKPGADTTPLGASCHDYPEEIFILSGRLYDQAFQCWLEPGHYASRPPGEVHGPFQAPEECMVLEISYPSQGETVDE